MPNWLIIVIVLIAVVPGVAVILIGVVALFMSPPAHDPLLDDNVNEDTEGVPDHASSSDPNDPLTPRK
jgi:hypothetical protein